MAAFMMIKRDLIVIFIALITLSTCALPSKKLNIVTPKVGVFIGKVTHTSFANYSTIYNLTQYIDRKIGLRCVSKSPNRWQWYQPSTDEHPLDIIGSNKTRENDTFTTDLSIYLSNTGYGKLVLNYSCQLVNPTKTRVSTTQPLVTCVRIMWKADEITAKLTEIVMSVDENMSLKNCSNDVEIAESANCSRTLKVDLKKMEATCPPRQHIGSIQCPDLDTCESHRFWNAAKTIECGNPLGTNRSNVTKFPRPVNGTPIIIYCQTNAGDFVWDSSVQLYTGFSAKNNLWTMSFYDNFTKAMSNSVMIHALSLEEKRQFANLKEIVGRTHFAENETVEFYCFAVKSLFMEGFQWAIGNNSAETPYTGNGDAIHEINDELHIHIVRKNITLSIDSSQKTITWISCKAPVWNSEEWHPGSLNVTLSPAIAPTIVNLIEIKNNGTQALLTLNCSFEGWPLPEVTWSSDSDNLPDWKIGESPLMPNDQNYDEKPGKGWHKLLYLKVPASTTKYTCNVQNVKGSVNETKMIRIVGEATKLITIIIAVTCSIIAALMAVLAVVYWRYRRNLHLTQQRNLTKDEITEFYDGASRSMTSTEALQLPYNPDLEIPFEQLQIDDAILGSGQFGLVLKGSIGSLPVAIKTIKPTADLIYLKSLLSELKVLQYIGSHRSIVNLIGATTSNIKNREAYLILDYCPNGNLVSFLRECRDRFVDFFGTSVNKEEKSWPLYENSKSVTLTTGNLLTFASEIASAMDHLASKNVIHGDLAARNVLITEDIHAKICDFGLSKQLLHYTVYVQKMETPLPLRWMSPESLQDMEFSLASDKWSYGVILFEIFSLAEIPYPGTQWGFDSYKMLQEGYRMEKPRYANESIYKLMLECWNHQPQERPNFLYVIRRLQEEEEKLT